MSVKTRSEGKCLAVKAGKWISCILFVSAFLSLIDFENSVSRFGWVFWVVAISQLLLSIFLYSSSVSLVRTGSNKLFRYSCIGGVFYAVCLGGIMGLRQYSELGVTYVLPITVALLMMLIMSPFLWLLKQVDR